MSNPLPNPQHTDNTAFFQRRHDPGSATLHAEVHKYIIADAGGPAVRDCQPITLVRAGSESLLDFGDPLANGRRVFQFAQGGQEFGDGQQAAQAGQGPQMATVFH